MTYTHKQLTPTANSHSYGTRTVQKDKQDTHSNSRRRARSRGKGHFGAANVTFGSETELVQAMYSNTRSLCVSVCFIICIEASRSAMTYKQINYLRQHNIYSH